MAKPGQSRPPRRRSSDAVAEVPKIGSFEVEGSYPGQPKSQRVLRPADFGAQRVIATLLASEWQRRSYEVAFGTSESYYWAVLNFLTFLKAKEVENLAELVPDLLFEYENYLVDTAPGVGHLHASRIWTLLRSVRELPDESANVVSHAPAIAMRTSEPTEALTETELRGVVAACRRDISKARHRILNATDADAGAKLLLWHETLSFYVLLQFETALSMDVLKHLAFTDTASTRVTDWEYGKGSHVELTYHKVRGGRTPTPLLLSTDGQFSAGTLLLLLRDLSSPVRELAKGRTDLAVGPWLGILTKSLQMRHHIPDVQGLRLIPVMSLQSPFAYWLTHHGLDQASDRNTSTTFRAIRPAAKTQRIVLTDNSGLHMVDITDDQGVDVYMGRYTKSARLMRDVGATFFESIAGRAEEVARHFEPTIVHSDGTTDGAEYPPEMVHEVLEGDHEFGLTACATPHDSPMPGQQSGDLCGVAFRACFECPSALVTPRHVRRMETVKEQAMEQQKVMPPSEWESVWGQAVRFIETALAKLGSDTDGFAQESSAVLDLGLRGGPR